MRTYYAGYYRHAIPPAPQARYREWLAHAERQVGRGRVLEIGAGSGGFVAVALAQGWSVDATEVSASGLEMLRRTGARVFAGELSAARYATNAFDLVVSLEVIEHLATPLEHLREVCRVLRPGGMLLLTTPNFDGLSRRWLGLNWRVITPEHLGYFTPSTLAAALGRGGFTRWSLVSRSLDVSTWRRPASRDGVRRFDAHASARLRDGVEGRVALRALKNTVNVALAATGLGDSLLAWAEK